MVASGSCKGGSFKILTDGEVVRMVIRARDILADLEAGVPEAPFKKELSHDIDLDLVVVAQFGGLLKSRIGGGSDA